MNTNNTTIATVNHIPTSADDIKVGDIFSYTLVYYHTSVTFLQVVSRTKKFVTVKEMKSANVYDDKYGSTGTTLPTSELRDREYRCKISEKHGKVCFNFHSGVAYPWDGSAKYISND
jgi:hypothetical protein